MVNRNEDQDRSRLEDHSKDLFDASVAELNANIRSRLTQARHAAVAAMARQRTPWAFRRWMPATGMVAAALTGAIVLLTHTTPPQPFRDALAADDMTLLLEGDNLDLIEEMEFYAWLDSETLLETDSDPAGQTGGAPQVDASRS